MVEWRCIIFARPAALCPGYSCEYLFIPRSLRTSPSTKKLYNAYCLIGHAMYCRQNHINSYKLLLLSWPFFSHFIFSSFSPFRGFESSRFLFLGRNAKKSLLSASGGHQQLDWMCQTLQQASTRQPSGEWRRTFCSAQDDLSAKSGQIQYLLK